MVQRVRVLDGSRVVWEIVGVVAGGTVVLVALTTFVGIEGQRIIAALSLTTALAVGAVRLAKRPDERAPKPGLVVPDMAPVGLLALGAALIAGSVGGWAILAIPAVAVILAGGYMRATVRGQKVSGRPG